MRITFWGVRGIAPVSGPAYVRYGGDTMCIGIEAGGANVMLDAGSGLRACGAALAARPDAISAHIILSHLHLDHVLGLNQFAPLFRSDARIHLYAPEESLRVGQDALLSLFRPPLFPIDDCGMPASIALRSYGSKQLLTLPDVVIDTVPVNHPGGCSALIVRAEGRKLAYVTDHEHGEAAIDDGLAAAIAGADLLIYDATFSEAEFAAHRAWGHSSWDAGVRLKRQSGVKLLVLAHHHPDRTDADLDRMAQAAAEAAPNVLFAHQGLSLTL